MLFKIFALVFILFCVWASEEFRKIMSSYPWLPLALGACLYIWQAYEYFRLGDQPMSMAFLAYAMANVGFVWGIIRNMANAS